MYTITLIHHICFIGIKKKMYLQRFLFIVIYNTNTRGWMGYHTKSFVIDEADLAFLAFYLFLLQLVSSVP